MEGPQPGALQYRATSQKSLRALVVKSYFDGSRCDRAVGGTGPAKHALMRFASLTGGAPKRAKTTIVDLTISAACQIMVRSVD